MNNSQRILSRASGPLSSKLMFIAEAPGRLGADQLAIPLHGDKTGHNFEELLKFSGLDRTEIFITNAVLCNPKDADGNNSTPLKEEVINCLNFLKKQIELVNPDIIVALGATALHALSLIEQHNLSLKKDVRTMNEWWGRKLIPLYHPGQRAMLHRSFANQRSDYQFVHDSFKHLYQKKAKPKNISIIKEDILAIVSYILSKNELTYFALHKIFYLIEYNSFIKLGYRLTNAYIIRQKDGPYCTDLHINRLKNSIPDLQTRFISKTSFIIYKPSDIFNMDNDFGNILSSETINIIDNVLDKYGKKSNASLKRAVYFTRPMRNILYYESQNKINLYNTPIEFVNGLVQ
ncbi:uracil-DNA glycosylase family protein [Mucilaginibacter sp. McL0603]|uniref:uracil-DNA glycosylase family protein n=1 Tax=Mucilaginibacter sp. McL0603 TaxID=3415670 RepID=UPI003CF489BF